jgi:pimeloyl-ACP methyl ester carboxylesterase
VVAGLSLGGYVAIELAARHPERVAGLVLAGCSRDLDGAMGIYVRAVGRLMRRGWLRPSRERVERKTLQLFPPALADVAEEQRKAGVYPEPLGEAFRGMAARRWSEALALYPGPTLIANGERDTMARKGEARFAAAARAGRVRTIANAGHACSLQQPAEFDRALRDFMPRVGPPWFFAEGT